ncbi:MAG: thioredoxin domain-containing protein [Elusimicrobia bacterium]|nr:thioredoxin domain-containing protein [Elusimicrobiota bacterium]
MESHSAASKPNHLIHEKSPYLLQHAYNPVEWYPWREEAFAKARKENKPILVSIGYSTCHWCHVMERESYSNPKIAELMNKYLISIKVDREERPDVDKLYITAVSAMTGSAGWPLNVFVTHDLQPFFGGTYFPPEPRWGHPGWPQVVEQIGSAWQDPPQREKLLESGANIQDLLKQVTAAGGTKEEILDLAWLHRGFESLRTTYDAQRGGFGPAPKFPMPVHQHFLFRYADYAQRTLGDAAKAQTALKMALHTLRTMAQGGIYDQIGGGFHRYSTDDRWFLPHFEKMLYDNAQLALNYVDAYQISQNEEFAQVARETLGYVLRDMTHPQGGFYSAEDADSLPPELAGTVSASGLAHKAEVAFYIWRQKEILDILGQVDGDIFCFRYGVESGGNVASDPHEEFSSKNVLSVAHSLAHTAKQFGLPETTIVQRLEQSKRRLFQVRAKRPRPDRDDKILTSWNGLMISALARAHQILGKEKPKQGSAQTTYLEAAEAAAQFIRANLYDSKQRLLFHRWRENERSIPALADDFAFLVQGLLDLYEASFNPTWLEWAINLTEEQNKLFYDTAVGGFYMTAANHDPHLLFRIKEDTDNVEPSASSVATLNLLRLAQFTDRADFRQAAEKTLRFFSPNLKQASRSLLYMLGTMYLALSKPYQIIIAGDPASTDTQAMLTAVHARFIPNKVLMVVEGGPIQAALAKHLPFLATIKRLKNQATAYVCINYTCQLPTTDPEVVAKQLGGDVLR